MNEQKTKRQQILDAAYVVFSRKGYYCATVDEIVLLADTGKGTVYNYFNNKEHLFYTVVSEKSTPFHKALTAIAVNDESSIDKIKAIIKVCLNFYALNADLWRVLVFESGFTDSQKNKYREIFRVPIGIIEAILKEGIKHRLIKQCDVQRAAHGLFSVIIMLVFQNFIKDDVSESAAMIADIFLYGVAEK